MNELTIFLVIIYALGIFLHMHRESYRIRKNINANSGTYEAKYQQRRIALKRAQIFLFPYTSMWNNLKLGNKYCVATLKNGRIRCHKKDDEDVYFFVTNCGVRTADELWDMLCITFEYNTYYKGLIEFCQRCGCKISESPKSKLINSEIKYIDHDSNLLQKNSVKQVVKDSKSIVKVDINNCSEIEMTELPGINVIMSKRAIKKREEIGGFKKIEDFFLYLHIKPHMEKQLRERICLNKMKGLINLPRNTERSVDL